MKKLCLIYNIAPHYREAIFKAIDKEYDCDWFFGKMKSDIMEMDISLLKSAHYYKCYGNHARLYWKCCVDKLFMKKYKTFFMLAESRALSDYVFFGLKSLFFPKKKIFVWTHGWYGKESKTEAALKRWQLRRVDGIFCYSNYGKCLMVENGIPEEKIFVIHNSLHYDQQKTLRENIQPSDLYKSHFGNDNPVLIFIGRLTAVKQLDVLVDAVHQLAQNGEIYNIVFVGDGEKRADLEQHVNTLGMEQQVWFYGACYDEKINAELIFNADLCVAPGNIGLTAMHAMVFGCPSLTHNDFKWQMPEFEAIRDGETGTFFDRGNTNSLAAAISRWFADKADKRQQVRETCYMEIDTLWNPYYQMEVIKQHISI